MKTYDIHYSVGGRDWRYAGDVGATTAAAAVKKFKREGSNRWAFEGKRLRARLRKSNPGKRKPARARSGARTHAANKRGNPVRVDATVTGSGTGWIKAKAVKVRRSGKGFVVDVKR